MSKKEKLWERHFVPELSGGREIGLPPADAKNRANKLIAKHMQTRGFVLIYTCIM